MCFTYLFFLLNNFLKEYIIIEVLSDPSGLGSVESRGDSDSKGIVYAWDEFDEHWVDYRVVNLAIGVQPKQSSSDGIPQELRETSWAELLQRSQHLFSPGNRNDRESDSEDEKSSTG